MTARNSSKEAKYRPVLTASQITYLLEIAKNSIAISYGDDSDALSIITTLAPFKAKIDNGATNPAYITKSVLPKQVISIADLGGTTDSETYIERLSPTACATSKGERWALAHAKFCISPAACTLEEIKGAKEHMYLNDLMSAEEMQAFEATA